MESDNRFSYFFLGLGLGAAVGLLFAPRSGAETRDYLRTKADEGKEFLKTTGDEVVGSTNDLIEKGKEAITRQKDQVQAAVDAGKQAYREAVAGAGSSRAGA